MSGGDQDRIYIEGRLPNKPWLTVPEIALAFNRCSNTIVAYIESGRIRRVRNTGTGRKRFFEAWREDVVELWVSQFFNG